MTYAFAQTMVDMPPSLPFEHMFLKTILMLVFVLFVVVLALKVVLPRLSVIYQQRSSSRIQILDRQGVDARRVVYLVQIDGRRVAFVASEHGVAKLCEWDEKSEAQS